MCMQYTILEARKLMTKLLLQAAVKKETYEKGV